MKQRKYKADTAAQAADNLTATWREHSTEPDNWEKLNNLAGEIDAECRGRLPAGSLTGMLAGHERDICQRALQWLLGSYLFRNTMLGLHTAIDDVDEIYFELRRSIGSALKYTIARRARSVRRNLRQSVEITESNGGSHQHPAAQALLELSKDKRRALLEAVLQLAVAEERVSRNDVELVRWLVIDGKTVRETAADLRITTNALYQRLRKVSHKLGHVLQQTEVPLL